MVEVVQMADLSWPIAAYHGITLFNVEELSMHGGSLRICCRRDKNAALAVTGRVNVLPCWWPLDSSENRN